MPAKAMADYSWQKEATAGKHWIRIGRTTTKKGKSSKAVTAAEGTSKSTKATDVLAQ
jgi:hypothetical protein